MRKLMPLVLLVVLCPRHAPAAEPLADLILVNGKIITADGGFTIAKAMAVRGDRIVAVGSDEAVAAHQGEGTRRIDLGGACVLPGLIDSHCHPSAAAVAELDHERPPMESVSDVLAYVESRAKVRPEGEWIFISQRFLTRLREHRYPTREELDRAAPRHPVMFRTGPDCSVNSAAMRAAGIDRSFQPAAGAVAERDAAGELSGVFRNMNGVFNRHIKSPPITREARYEATKKLLGLYNSVGLTTAYEREGGDDIVALYEELLAKGDLTVRIHLSYSLDVGGDIANVDRQLTRIARLPIVSAPKPMLRCRTAKFYLDGGMLTGSAFMSEPWGVSELYRISDPTYRGLQFIPDEKLHALAEKINEHGLQAVAHCQGDGAVDAFVRAFEALDRKRPVRDLRDCIGHGSFVRLDIIRRAARVGVIADSQPAWLYLDGSVLLKHFGAARLRYFIPLRTWFAEGGIVGGGSDHMIGFDPDTAINPYNPFLGMWIAITRRARWVEEPIAPEEAISREQAIRLYTTNCAFVGFAEREKGSLEPGKLADFVVIDRDILTCPVDEIRAIKAVRTYVGGKLVYVRP